MYGRLRPDMFTRGQFARAAAYALGQSAAHPGEPQYNTFEKVAGEVFNDLESRRHALQQATGAVATSRGLGPASTRCSHRHRRRTRLPRHSSTGENARWRFVS